MQSKDWKSVRISMELPFNTAFSVQYDYGPSTFYALLPYTLYIFEHVLSRKLAMQVTSISLNCIDQRVIH